MTKEAYTTMVGGSQRVCGKCHKTLPLTEFRKWTDNRGAVARVRYESYCKSCRKAYMKKIYKDKTSPYYQHEQESSKKAYGYVKARRKRDPEYDARVRERNRKRAKRLRENRKRARMYGA